MSDPWVLSSMSGNNVPIVGMDWASSYYDWFSRNISRFNGSALLCNWFPLTVLVEFAAEKGLRVRLDYWAGQAPQVRSERFWDTSRKYIFDSHGGDFSSKVQYLSRVCNKVTARMIGSLNSVAIEQNEARPGDLVSLDLGDIYWHVELITGVSAGIITTESGSVPAVVPKNHQNSYRNLAQERRVYQGKPRRWEFEEILTG